MAYKVESEQHVKRLAEYETRAYRPTICQISFTGGGEPGDISGTTFQYAGNPIDVAEGVFALDVWLRRTVGEGG